MSSNADLRPPALSDAHPPSDGPVAAASGQTSGRDSHAIAIAQWLATVSSTTRQEGSGPGVDATLSLAALVDWIGELQVQEAELSQHTVAGSTSVPEQMGTASELLKEGLPASPPGPGRFELIRELSAAMATDVCSIIPCFCPFLTHL